MWDITGDTGKCLKCVRALNQGRFDFKIGCKRNGKEHVNTNVLLIVRMVMQCITHITQQ